MRGISEELLRTMYADIKESLNINSAISDYHYGKLSAMSDAVGGCHELQEPWIPIEIARKDGTRYLLFNIFWEAPCTDSFDGRQWVLHSDLPPFKNQPTHYQELPIHKPEPPR